jgi:hypothetical protein
MACFVTTPRSLADDLVAQCVSITEAFVNVHAPNWRLPRVFAGHAVGADVRADVIFTLGHLAASGVAEIAGTPIDDAITVLLRAVDGAATHSFFSYRIAETLLDRGRFAANPLLHDLDDSAREQVVQACDSSSFIPLLDRGQLPRNYAAVLSRCEQARVELGLIDDRAQLDSLLDRLRAVLAENPRHALDDSNDGSGRYDIYTADVWLFCEPLAEAIGTEWRAGLRDALALVEILAGSDGTAIPWGRSTGVLSIALTIELAAAALTHGLGDDPAAWLRRGADATTAMSSWFGPDGVVNAHQHRDQDRYRGPARRLQLTFDLLGKLAWAARTFRSIDTDVVAANRDRTYPAVDALHRFDDHSNARLWSVRRPGLSFAVPFVGAARSHYLPAPVRPGLFEVPVDQDLPLWTPLIISSYQRYTAGGLPDTIEHAPSELHVQWDRFVPSTDTFTNERPPALAGSRDTHFRVEGRSLVVDDALTFDTPPQAIAVAIPELAARPLSVEFDTNHSLSDPHQPLGERQGSVVDVAGVAEWQTSWSSIARVHQLDLDPATELRYSVRVTPKLRVGSTAHGHHYDRSLYDPIADRVFARPSPVGWTADGSVALDDIDVFHLHWPEWLAFDDLDEHGRIADAFDDVGVPVVWTAHNLTPHSKQPERFDPVYALWAQRATTVIHHSEWGRTKMRDRYVFAERVRHVVIPHGHFGGLWHDHLVERGVAEHALGFAPCAFRIGIVGAPPPPRTSSSRCGRSRPTSNFPTTPGLSPRTSIAASMPLPTPDDCRLATSSRCRSIPTARCSPPGHWPMRSVSVSRCSRATGDFSPSTSATPASRSATHPPRRCAERSTNSTAQRSPNCGPQCRRSAMGSSGNPSPNKHLPSSNARFSPATDRTRSPVRCGVRATQPMRPREGGRAS